MKKRNLRQNSSGQVIIITALLVALLSLSTAMYVINTEKEVPSGNIGENNVFQAYKQSASNTLISALANITNGGNSSVLNADLNRLTGAIVNDSYNAIVQINYVPLNSAGYQNGIWISWGADGQGISSACANFVFDSHDPSTFSNFEYDANVTTEVNVSGYSQLNSSLMQVNLTVNLLNEGEPALAKNFVLYFEGGTGSWVNVDSPALTDFRNGTYLASFTTETAQSSDPLLVSLLCQDMRGIVVGANVTCATAGP